MANITLPAVLGAGAFVQQAGEIDKLKMGLVGIMGDSKKAALEFDALRKLAKKPGLDLRSAVEGSVRLQAINFSASEARHSIDVMANALALVGGTEADLKGVSVAISQIISKNKVHAEEINQIAERVPQVRMAMMDAFGTANTEVLQKMGLGARAFVDGIIDELARLPKAEDNVSNALVNMRDEFKLIAADIGMAVLPTFLKVANVVANVAKFFVRLNARMNGGIVKAIALAAALGPLAFAYAKILRIVRAVADIKFWSNMLKSLSPVKLAVLAIAAVVALIIVYWDEIAAAIVTAYNYFVDFYNSSKLLRIVCNSILKLFRDVWATIKMIGTGGKKIFQALWDNIWNPQKATKAITDALKEVAVQYGKDLKDNMDKAAENINGDNPLEKITKEQLEDFLNIEAIKAIFADLKKTFLGDNFGGGGSSRPYVNTGSIGRVNNVKSQSTGHEIGDAEFIPMDTPLKYIMGELEDFIHRIMEGIMEGLKYVTQVIDQLGSTLDSFYDKKQRLIDNDFQKQKRLVENSKMLEADKNRFIIELESRKDAKIRALNKRRAKADKAMAIMASIVNGAVAVNNALATGPPPFNFIVAGLVGALAAAQTSIIASTPIPALARGGLAHSSTLAIVGDNPNAHVDPEVISPVSKLVPMIRKALGGSETHLTGSFVARGNDLELIASSAKRRKGRMYGSTV
jgi:tape measure domain-containing protein